jgi:predicted AlkP superfamily phosphohydrolase/phosphomutase
MRGKHAIVSILAAAGIAAAVSGNPGDAGARPGAGAGPSTLVVLGFDGADAGLVEKWMDDGSLPNLARLRREGTFSDLRPTNPPQTPVSWSTFATGMDPGKTEIFDFLKRDLDTYTPDFAMITPATKPFLFGTKNPLYLALIAAGTVFLVLLILIGLVTRRAAIGLLLGLVLGSGAFFFVRSFVAQNIPAKRPIAINNRKGTPFWQILSKHGIHSTVIRVPQTFPPDANPGGRLLSGLGVPDIRGTFGTYSYYTSEPPGTTGKTDTEMGGKVVPLDVAPGDPSVQTFIYGPFNKLFDDPPEIHLPMTLDLDWEGRRVDIRFQDQTVHLGEGEWSDFVRFTFPIRKVIKVRGIARFYLLEMGPQLKLYLSAINLDPLDPIVPITYPEGFAKQIHDQIGDWKTLGWALDTWAFNEKVTDEAIFAQDLDFTVTKFEKILDAFLDDPDERVYTQIFYYTDRVAHMFYRLLDPQNPAYDPKLADEWGDYVREIYERMDRTVGHVLDRLPPDGVLLVCSDHGFSTWRRSFNMNTWLVRNGFMKLKGQGQNKQLTLDDLFVEGQFWPNVDWSRTKAYALGLGSIYINQLGREREGIVAPGAEYDQVCREIQDGLEACVDSLTGEHPVAKVYRRDEMYSDYDPDLIPDLRAANNLGYRVSWQTSLGGIPKEMFDDHTERWSGDHCSLDPKLVKGILFCNRPLRIEGQPGIEDLFPTILHLFSVPIPGDVDGKALELAAGTRSPAGGTERD